tara:strand:+ start:11314 stop:11697 length:384 start_codon:yes stop_codon:yes gene_type:complete
MSIESPLKLLVVEDEPFLRDLLLMKFNNENVNVTYTDQGEDALRLAQEERPAAILLDLVLPGMSGFEILHKLKESEETKDMPVIVLSNLGQESDIDRCVEAGAAKVLVKAHSSPAAIIATVHEVVGV